jgi:hypothetical protein
VDNKYINPLKTEGILGKFKKVTSKSGRISKIMVAPESLSQYLSNEYRCYGVSIELYLPIFFAF